MTDRNDFFLYFDLGNVIALFDHELIVQNLLPHCEASADEIRDAVLGSDLLRDYELGHVTTEEFYQGFCTATGCQATMPQVVNAACDIFEINRSIIPLISNLKQAGYQLGILSNTCEAHWEFLFERYFVLGQFFDVIALSYQLSVLKPDPEIYEKAAGLAGVEPAKIFFVDDRSEHVAAARKAGWRAEVYQSTKELNDQLNLLGVVCNF